MLILILRSITSNCQLSSLEKSIRSLWFTSKVLRLLPRNVKSKLKGKPQTSIQRLFLRIMIFLFSKTQMVIGLNRYHTML